MALDSADENITVDQGGVNVTNTTLVGGVHYDDFDGMLYDYNYIFQFQK